MAAKDNLHPSLFHGRATPLNDGDEVKGRYSYLHRYPNEAATDARESLQKQRGQTQLFGAVYHAQDLDEGEGPFRSRKPAVVTGLHSYVNNPNAVTNNPRYPESKPQPKPAAPDDPAQKSLF